MRDVQFDACINLINDLARLLGVPPEKLGYQVQVLQAHLSLALSQLGDGPRGADLEHIQQLEERNGKLEAALTSSRELLQQHTVRWATACNMLTKLEAMATPSLYVAGKAYLEGLQATDAQLLLHLIQALPTELAVKLTEVRSAITQARNMFGTVVPAYQWDKELGTFERVVNVPVNHCMSKVPGYVLITNPNLPLMGQLKVGDQNAPGPGLSGPDLNRSKDPSLASTPK